jgi:hypothetical protein
MDTFHNAKKIRPWPGFSLGEILLAKVIKSEE